MSGPPENPIARVLGGPVRFIQIVCGWALVAICLATLYDIVARRVFNHSVQGVNEIGAYMLAVCSAFGFASALLQKAHSRVDFLFARMPATPAAVLNALAAVLLAALGVFAAWQGFQVLEESIDLQARANTPLQTPLWLPQMLWLAGLAIFAGVAGACAVHAVWLLFVDRARLNAWYGPLSIEGQIEVETQGTVKRPDEPPR